MYRAGYEFKDEVLAGKEMAAPLIWAVAFLRFLGPTQAQHHFGTSLASIVNASTLKFTMIGDAGKWPTPSHDVILPQNLPNGSAHDVPNLRPKSVVDTSDPDHQTFGQRLDSMANEIADWGIGNWVDEFIPSASLNYTTSGVPGSEGQLDIDLSKTDGTLAWSIVKWAMQLTV